MIKQALCAAAMTFVIGTRNEALARPAPAPELRYDLTEGENINLFFRDGPVAAHTLLRSSRVPRILVAFPAEDSGVGLWFAPTPAPVHWRVETAPARATLTDAQSRPLYGVQIAASLDAPRLVPTKAVLSSVRYLRDYQSNAPLPPQLAVQPRADGNRLEWSRDRADGAPGYRLMLTVTHGRIEDGTILAGADGRIGLTITAASGEPPLHAIPESELLNASAAPDPAARRALRFLSYREKFLAGSWRFNTYFGRDTLMSLSLLMPALRPPAVEAGVSAVFARLSDDGQVAHEEGIGEFAVLDHKAHGSPATAQPPILDWGMVDSSYMLAPVAGRYLLGPGRARAAAYLAHPLDVAAHPGERQTAGALLVRNLRLVVASARAFAADPTRHNLIAIKPGRPNGEWRDSGEGLGRGRYAYDINAALVPASLEAAARLTASGLLDPYLTPADRVALKEAGAMARVWAAKAPPLFTVQIAAARAQIAATAFAHTLDLPVPPPLEAPLAFHALSLNANGTPVPIVNSDEGFALFFTDPAPADLDLGVAAIMRPFPYGLMTPIGLLVANAAQDSPEMQARFTPAAYHGAVVWSWQQALLAAGLERQLRRTDLPAATRARLTAAQTDLWRVIAATRAYANSELWSWVYRDGRYRVVAFGAGAKDVDESDAAQLWSTVYLAVRPPASAREERGHR